MDEAKLIGLGGLITVLLTGLGGLFVTVLKALRDRHTDQVAEKKANRADALQEWQAIVYRQGEQIARMEQVLDEQQRVIAEQHAREAACDAEVGELFVWLRHFRDAAVRFQTVLQKLGHETGEEIPPMPERRSRLERAEFIRRTSEQNAVLARTPQNPAGPEGRP